MNFSYFVLLLVLMSTVTLAMMSFAVDLSDNYSLNVSTGLRTSANTTINNLEDFSNTVEDAVRSEQSWLETTYTLLFKSNRLIEGFVGIFTTGGELIGSLVAESSDAVALPSYAGPVLFVVVGLIVLFAIISVLWRWVV